MRSILLLVLLALVSVAGQTRVAQAQMPDPVAAAAPADSIDSTAISLWSINREEIERLDPRTLGELLESRLPGVYSLDIGARNPQFRTLRLRGPSNLSGCPAMEHSRDWTSLFCPGPIGLEECSVCGPTVLVDGVAIAPSAVANLPVEHVERVDVVRGPTAALVYGSGAGEGVVLVTTRKGDPGTELAGRLGAATTSTPYLDETPWLQSFAGTASGGIGAATVFASGSRTLYDGHVAEYDGRQNTASVGGRATLGRLDAAGSLRWSEGEYGEPGWAGVYYELYLDGLLPSWGDRIQTANRLRTKRTTVSADLAFHHTARWVSRVTAGQDFFDLDSRYVPTMRGGDSLTVITNGRYSAPSIRLRSDYSRDLGMVALNATAGVDRTALNLFGFESFHRQTTEPRVIFSQGDLTEEEHTRTGGFLAGRVAASGFVIGGGLRIEDQRSLPGDSVGAQLSPHLAASFHGLSPAGWSVIPSIGWSRGGVVPAAFMQSGLAPEIAGNRDLEPASVTAVEARLDVAAPGDDLALSLNLFDQTTDGVFALVPDDSLGTVFSNSNGSISNRGVEAILRWETALVRLLASGSALENSVDGISSEFDGAPVLNDPAPSWTLWSEAAVQLGRWLPVQAELGGRVRGVGTRWANDRRAVIESLYNEPTNASPRDFDPVSQIDLFASANLAGRGSVTVEVSNLTDNISPYVPEVVVGGREIRVFATLRWSP